jgi:hypothetical protein
LIFCTLAGVAIALKVVDWYSNGRIVELDFLPDPARRRLLDPTTLDD